LSNTKLVESFQAVEAFSFNDLRDQIFEPFKARLIVSLKGVFFAESQHLSEDRHPVTNVDGLGLVIQACFHVLLKFNLLVLYKTDYLTFDHRTEVLDPVVQVYKRHNLIA